MSVTISGTNGITSNSTVIPNNEVLVTLDDTQTLTNKTLGATTFTGNITSTGNPSLNLGTGALTAGAGTFSSNGTFRAAGNGYNNGSLMLQNSDNSAQVWAVTNLAGSVRIGYNDGTDKNVGTFSSTGLAVTGEINSSSNSANWASSDRSLIDWYSVGSKMRLVAARSGANSSSMSFYTYNAGSSVEAVTIDSVGNVGIGVTPSGWYTGKAVEVGFSGNAIWGATANNFHFLAGSIYGPGNGYTYKVSGEAVSSYKQTAGAHYWYTAPSGTAGNAISFTNVMTLDASGNLLVGPITKDATMGTATKLQINTMGMGSVSGSGTGAADTGISINAGSKGGTVFLIANRNTSDGTNTHSAVYIVRLYYNGNNAPTTYYVGGSADFVTFGVSGSQTLTVTNAGNGDANYCWIISA